MEDPAALKEALRNSRGVIFAASGKGYWSPAKVDNQARHRVTLWSRALPCRRIVHGAPDCSMSVDDCLCCAQGVANVAAAAKQTGAQRVVLISSCLVTTKHKCAIWCKSSPHLACTFTI